MNPDKLPLLETYEKALAQFVKHGHVLDVRCERCGNVIQIVPKGRSAMIMSCSCGAYNDNLRGL